MISPHADRMGVRLDGRLITPEQEFNIVSDGIAKGAIQSPGDATLTVFTGDRQTTGGYRKIAKIILTDLDRFAQMPLASTLRFLIVSRKEAVAAAYARWRWLESMPSFLVPKGSSLSTELLLGLSLIDGVTAGN